MHCVARRVRREILLAQLVHVTGECKPGPNAEEEIISALRACGTLGDLELTRRIHSLAQLHSLYVANTLVSTYAKCSSTDDAWQVFRRMPEHATISWNALLVGYADNSQSEQALELFISMESQGLQPDPRTFVAALMACANLATKDRVKSLETGMSLHLRALENGWMADTFLGNSLVNVYAKCGCMPDARLVFDRMPRHDSVSWNTVILGYAANGENELAMEFFYHMEASGCEVNSRSYIAALMACLNLAEREESQEVAGELLKLNCLENCMKLHYEARRSGCETYLRLGSMLLDLYAKCGSLMDARLVFDRMQVHDVVSWTTMIVAYVEHREGGVALELFSWMQRRSRCEPNERTYVGALMAVASLAGSESTEVDGKLAKTSCLEKARALHSQLAERGFDCSDMFVGSALVSMYSKCGSMPDAQLAFDRIHQQDVVSWTALLLGYAENDQGELALELFHEMKRRGCSPDSQTYVAAIMACSSCGAVDAGRRIHAEISQNKLLNNTFLVNSLVDFYGKCGCMVEAEQVFASAMRNLVTWCALVAGYARQGDTKRVLQLFQKMREEGFQPNRVTFLSVLSACSHAGLMEKCWEHFQVMESQYGVTPGIEHYHCMVDMLARANLLEDAVAMVKSMPFKPNAITWKTILGACLKWKNVEVGRLAFQKLRGLDPSNDVSYVLMASICLSVGLWEEHSKLLDVWKQSSRLFSGM